MVIQNGGEKKKQKKSKVKGEWCEDLVSKLVIPLVGNRLYGKKREWSIND